MPSIVQCGRNKRKMLYHKFNSRIKLKEFELREDFTDNILVYTYNVEDVISEEDLNKFNSVGLEITRTTIFSTPPFKDSPIHIDGDLASYNKPSMNMMINDNLDWHVTWRKYNTGGDVRKRTIDGIYREVTYLTEEETPEIIDEMSSHANIYLMRVDIPHYVKHYGSIYRHTLVTRFGKLTYDCVLQKLKEIFP